VKYLFYIGFLLGLGSTGLSASFDAEGLTPLHRAAGRGDVQLITELLRTDSPLVLDSKMGVSVLHKAVYSGNAQAVKAVLDGGAKAIINLQSPSNGNTLLHDALYFKGRDWSVLQALLDAGANVRIKNRAGLTPMESAAKLFSNDITPLDMMSQAESRFYPLSYHEVIAKIKANDLSAVLTIFARNPSIDINGVDEQGMTMLMWAAREGFVEMTEYLLAKGANPNQNDEWMRANAGHKAAFWGRVGTLKLLIQDGLNLDARGGYNGYTALHDAAVRNHTEAALLLLDAGANCFIRGHDGKTTHSIATEKQNTAILSHASCVL
jgi:ankyrin repeat protein